MHSVSSLVLGVLAGHALAAPAAKSASRLHSRHDVEANWGGAILEGKGWNYVTGVLTVPNISGQSADTSASIWVGIDGNKCQSAILQTGVTVYGDGTVETWTEWWKHDEVDYPTSISVAAGDQLRMTVHATSKTSGTTTIENLTQGGTQTKKFSSETPYPLCETDAEWIIEDYLHNGSPVDFVDFGSFSFTDAYAQNGDGNNYSPQGATIDNVEIDNSYKTNCSSDSKGVYCSYVN